MLRASFTDLPSEMLAADSQMTTGFFMLQSWMLDTRSSFLLGTIAVFA